MAQPPLKYDQNQTVSSSVPCDSLPSWLGLLLCIHHSHKAAPSWPCPHTCVPPGQLLTCLHTQHCQDTGALLLGDHAKGWCAMAGSLAKADDADSTISPRVPALSCSEGGTGWHSLAPGTPSHPLREGKHKMPEARTGSIHASGSGRRCWRGEAMSMSGPRLCTPAQLHWLHCFHEDLPQQSS